MQNSSSLAHKTFFVSLTHMSVQPVVVKEAFSAKFTQRVSVVCFVLVPLRPVRHRRNMQVKLIHGVKSMFVGKDFLEPDADIT